jgi:hypothetical protein
MSHVTFKLIHCAKTWHPWPDHIWLMSQSSHVIIYVLQLCHFHDNVTLHDYNHKILITMCAIDLVWPFFKIKTPWWRAHICNWKLSTLILKNITCWYYILDAINFAMYYKFLCKIWCKIKFTKLNLNWIKWYMIVFSKQVLYKILQHNFF